ncbi:RluA family pseudouridine synthase [Staphylococcus sp. 17KM0847]|uniref:RluA family pseudouridine synthase n=1 Tax=Staphylococcus sp. 17KM0847 TaxID=2583989 RepID=UPI0015DCB313|nr:RluA family pseudouridine synthase [Staphylococcus sp. 17KM0847]QLK85651.1 RluA family pseudouridine synthase [Staphylococcus sp. 17KM0847]
MIFTYTVTETQSLKTFLYTQYFSKKTISAIKRDGALLVNHIPKTVRHILQVGDKVEVRLPIEHPSPHLIPYDVPLDILYEDEGLLVVAKPQHQNSAPSREHPHKSLVEQALAHMTRQQEKGIPHIVTRLDRDTMGIVVIAKSRHLHHIMSLTPIKKVYECICLGQVRKPGIIDEPIARAADSIITRVVAPNGKYAKTLYDPIKVTSQYTWCRVQLLTGRTHQIRVHFQHMGHSIVGDALYGGAHKEVTAQLLKCSEICFNHPLTDKRIHIVSHTPNFDTLLATL